MWMTMDSNTNNHDHGRDQLKPPHDLLIGRKLRPLMPRPITTTNHPYSTLSTPSCCCTRNPKTLSWNHPLAAAQPLVSTRWNPTPEQLQALEEMYRRGIRTPSAEQIQQIAAKLGRLGKIEGKNVFYWFQNHKARERQKKRRQVDLLAGKKTHHAHTSPTKLTGSSRRYFENDKVPVTSSCSTPSEDSASLIAAADGWPQLHENETCCQLDLSPPPHTNKPTGQENASLNLFTVVPSQNHNDIEPNQTLQLFPISARAEQEIPHSFTIRNKITPSEFIEFLPTKN